MVPAVIISGIALYLSSQLGQRLGTDQMDHLQDALGELTRYSR